MVASEDADLGLLVFFEGQKGLGQGGGGFAIDGIADVGAIEDDGRDRARFLDANGGVHSVFLLS